MKIFRARYILLLMPVCGFALLITSIFLIWYGMHLTVSPPQYVEPPNPDEKYFPYQIGPFALIQPHLHERPLRVGDGAHYRAPNGRDIGYFVKLEPLKKTNYLAEDILADVPGTLIVSDGEQIMFIAYDEHKSFTAMSEELDLMNSWIASFPYAQLGLEPPAAPVRLELPPPEFLRTHPKNDESLKTTAQKAVKEWLTAHGAKIDRIVPSFYDTSSLVIHATSPHTPEMVEALVKENAARLKNAGYRQVFVNYQRFDLMPEANSSGKDARNKKPAEK